MFLHEIISIILNGCKQYVRSLGTYIGKEFCFKKCKEPGFNQIIITCIAKTDIVAVVIKGKYRLLRQSNRIILEIDTVDDNVTRVQLAVR